MQDIIYNGLSENGYRARVLSISHLEQLKQDIYNAVDNNFLSEDFCSYIKNHFDFEKPAGMKNASYIIIVAVPASRVRLYFKYKNKVIPLYLPPANVNKNSVSKHVLEFLKALLEPLGINVTGAKLPEKLLAVRSGLGIYGRNNICYVPGMGSFVRLAAFFTDARCTEDNWYEVKIMESCKNCSACRKACPTKSIPEEMGFINGGKCLCYLNEHMGEFPDWVDPLWHNSIIGCYRCQQVCPQNKEFLGRIEDIGEFSDEETEILLSGTPLNELPTETKAKLEKVHLLTAYYDCLPRNLKVLLDKAVAEGR